MPSLALYDIHVSTDFSCFVASQSSEVQEILGYIQTISPVKKATFSPTKYFNCNIQRSDRLVRAVCFSPTKTPLLEKYQKGRTAVRLHNIKLASFYPMLTPTSYQRKTSFPSARQRIQLLHYL